MNYQLVQLTALASGGNAILAKRIIPASFYPKHWVFRGCQRIMFDRPGRGRKQLDTPIAWVGHLAKNGVDRIHLSIPARSDRIGSATWILQSVLGGKTMAWTPAPLRGKNGKRTGDYRYRLTRGGTLTKPASVEDLADAKQSLQQALSEILAFTRRRRLGFEGCFEKGLNALNSSSPMSRCRNHPLVAARLYLLEARQLMAASLHSWVFGGMGSWNDVGFTDARKMKAFQHVNDRLYTALLSGMQVSVNSFPVKD